MARWVLHADQSLARIIASRSEAGEVTMARGHADSRVLWTNAFSTQGYLHGDSIGTCV